MPGRVAVILVVLTLNLLAARSATLPLAFEPNMGQTAGGSLFVARGQGYAIHFERRGLSLVSRRGAVRMELDNANAAPRVVGRRLHGGTANYLLGNPEEWRTGIPLYGAVEYEDVYPGINLVFYGNGRQLEYDFVVAPGARVSRIGLAFYGVEGVRIEDGGDLVLTTAYGELRHQRPRIYQRIGGRQVEVGGRFVLRGPQRAGFVVDAYDARQELVIDPTLAYGTFVGGSGDDRAWAVAVDSAGCAYLGGEAWPVNFPRTFAFTNSTGNQDAFLVKLNASGTGVVYATYFGGRGRDSARGVAVDADGSAYVAGFSNSADFPTTAGAYRTTPAGQEDAFVVKLNASGSGLVYSTLLGGAGADFATGIARDSTGNAYISGYTNSLSFPVTGSALQRAFGGGLQDAFVAKINASGTGLVFATYLGGQGNDVANGIAVDAGGFAYIAGYTDSANFPVRNALLSVAAGQGDAFVAKLTPAGDAVSYGTYLGGRQLDNATAVAVDATGNAYVTGSTASADFPVTSGAWQTSSRGGYDAFVAKLNTAGNALAYSTYLGGESSEEASAIAVDSRGVAYVAGYTDSLQFPLLQPVQPAASGSRDGFAAAVAETGAALSWSTYLGGAAEDRATGVAVDVAGSVYVAGWTLSSGFPVTAGTYRGVPAGSVDVFVTKLQTNQPPVVSASPSSGTGTSVLISFLASDPNGAADVAAMYIVIGPSLSAVNACYIAFDAHSHQLWLASDAATAWLTAPLPGQAGTVQNGQCSIDMSGSTVSAAGNTVTLTLRLTLKSTLSGRQNLYLLARDVGLLNTGWQQVGSWTTTATNQPPVASAAPASGSGPNAVVSFLASDPNGASDVAAVYIVIGSSLNTVNACYIAFDARSRQLWLASDAATAWFTAPLPGQAGTVQNSQCAIDMSGSTVSLTGNSVSLNLKLSFKPAFGGAQKLYLLAQDSGLLNTGWQQVGSWTVPPGS